MELVNLSNGQTLATNLREADTFWERLIGLMFTKALDSGSGLLIKPCQSIHTFFMNYAIDILYLNEKNEIVAMDEALQPGKIGKRQKRSVAVIELPEGVAKQTETMVGHVIQFK
ncbi:DUF192 domain-containing protein [Aquibacillus albus]|uniref:Uncharacterized membrane protein (UPF0127 family) n=1 Tax=Aquibacillus albus TaxID=1168171 RepID=A0ABS2N3D0_9BACI|nr:DUF192 domain-containing protein [Aquibacillus albus]MBM7572614.1 uncharacterized membrane protein (UPF0127 family) [Aquibacillus albus]